MTAPPSASIYFLILVACARGRRPIIRAPLDENMRQTVSGSESERGEREIPGADFEGGEEEVMLMLCLHLSSLSLFLHRPFVATAPIICQSSILLFTCPLFKMMMSTSKEINGDRYSVKYASVWFGDWRCFGHGGYAFTSPSALLQPG